MRFVEHWRISQDAVNSRGSLAFQLGSILPDWFERRPIHRWADNKERFLQKAEAVCQMPAGRRRDWVLGTMAHYICDYCCMAHNDEYYRYYRHRVYEVLSQKYYKRKRRNSPEKLYRISPRNLPELPARTGDLACDAAALVEAYAGKLHERIAALESPEWFRDERCADLDIRYAHALLRAMLELLEQEKGGALIV